MTTKIYQISKTENGIISAPFSPMFAAQSICSGLGLNLHSIHRLQFAAEETFQQREPELTGYDHIVIVTQARAAKGPLYGATLVIDMGHRLFPVATMISFAGKLDAPAFDDEYDTEKKIFAATISKHEIEAILSKVIETVSSPETALV